ncbi:unnamed protein product [Aspergillus oryzae]|uniref:Unnamed protein product n=1 Tax=Aspergillus oryzae TaxID=5062 RepID=A0AAN5BYT9_ASPOZ|nr:unnamed protein product [Aspergillus oryzae]
MFSFPTISHIKTRPQLFYSFTAEDGSAETAPSTADLFSTSFLLSNTSWHLQITRLLPESDFISGQLEDIRDLSKWMHEDLSNHLSQNGPRTSIEDVIVAGASAGALLALLTGGPLISVDVPELTSERISSVVDMERPIASTPPPKSFEDFVFNPRQQVGAEIFRRGLVAEFLLRGLIRHCPDGSTIEWQLPEKGETQEFEIDGISKFPSLPENADCLSPNVPDTWKSRRVFEVAHAVGLVECLDSQGLRHKEHIVDGAHHAFDIGANTGDDIHLNVMLPAVDWIAGVINHH